MKINSPHKKYPIGGYAPGNYMCTCIECEETFSGDKRAVHCEPCAIKLTRKKNYTEHDMILFAEFISSYPDKNRNVNGEMLHSKSKYDGSERTIDLLQTWNEQNEK